MKQVEIVSDISRSIVNRWARMVNNPLSSRPALEYIAREQNCEILFDDVTGSSYLPDESEDGPLGVALVNPNGPQFKVVRQMAHEMTHHVLYWWEDLRYPYVHNDVIAAWGASRELEEKICFGVEDLVMAAPFGFLPNGKMALPRSEGFVVRIYKTQQAEWERLRNRKPAI